MRFLVNRDYERLITEDDLNVVFDTGNNTTYTVTQRILDTEPAVQEEISGYLNQRYDLSQIFTDSPVYSSAVTYYGNNRVQYHEPDYDATSTYAIGARRSYNGSIYTCSTTISAPEAFTPAHWTFVCLDYQLFYALLPAAQYVWGATYNTGQQVWFTDNYVYTSKQNGNYYDPTNTTYWTKGSLYSFTNQLPTNGTYWILGDNRNAKLVQVYVDAVLYHAHATINQRNIPQLRIDRYMGFNKADSFNDLSVLGWLDKISNGRLNATLPELPPASEELSLRFSNSSLDPTAPTPPMRY